MRTKAEIQKDIDRAESDLRCLREELRAVEYKESRKRSNAYQNRKAMLDAAAPKMEDLVEVGDLIQVTGAKSGKYKRVVQITKGRKYGDKWYCGTVHGSAVWEAGEIVRDPTSGIIVKRRKVMKEDITKITDHGTNKIVAVQKHGHWIFAKDLVDT